MRVSFKKKIRQKYITPKVRKEVQDLFSQIEVYEHCIRSGEIEESHPSFVSAKGNGGISKPTEKHEEKINKMKIIVSGFYRNLRNIKKKMNKDELEIFKASFLNHERDYDIIQSLRLQRAKYYELKGYIYFLLAVGFNIIDTDHIEVKDSVKVLC